MASGNTLDYLVAEGSHPPASNAATPDVRNNIPVIDFDAATEETAYFKSIMPSHYAGGGVTVDIYWMATSATSGTVRWGLSAERGNEGNNDFDADNFGAESTADGTADLTNGKKTKTTITISHANLGSPSAGDPMRFKLRRVITGVTGNMAGDAEFVEAHVKET